MDVFSDWKDAHNSAQRQANLYARDMGVEKANEFGKTVYRVKMLPNPENRYGWELRCEVVHPYLPKAEV